MHLHLVTLHVKPSPQAVPLATALLRTSLAAKIPADFGLKVSCADYVVGAPVEEVAAAIAGVRAEIVGFSLYLWNRSEVIRLTQLLHDRVPGLLLLVGGPEATADPAGVMAAAPFDYLVAGEGEEAAVALLMQLLSGDDTAGIPGVVRRSDGEMSPVTSAPLLDFASIPSPWLSGLLDPYIPRGVLWQIARGCPFGCEFCYDGMGNRIVRRLPLTQVAAELDYLVKKGAAQIFVLDSTFNQDLPRAKTILKMIRSQAPQVHFHFEVRHEFLDRELAGLFASIPCSLQIGLQSADPQVLEQVGRPFDPELFSKKIELLNRSGAIFGFDLIYGLPGDSLEGFKKSLDFSLQHYPNQLDIFPLAILPGTMLAGRSSKLGLQHLDSPPYTVLSTPTFSAEDMGKARDLALACDIFYSRGRAVAWFNSIVTALNVAPSTLLDSFSLWLTDAPGFSSEAVDYPEEMIWGWQRDFLRDLFHKRKLDHLLPMALDLVDYHYHYAAVLLSPPGSRKLAGTVEKTDVLSMPLRCSPSSRLVEFHYDIDELLGLGEPHLAQASVRMKPVRSCAVLYSCDGEICSESLPRPYFQLLSRLDGHCAAGKVAASVGLSRKDAEKFIRIALGEGILVAVEAADS